MKRILSFVATLMLLGAASAWAQNQTLPLSNLPYASTPLSGAEKAVILQNNKAVLAPIGAVGPQAGTQSANSVLAGPTTGSPAAPTYRALVGSDLPAPTSSSLGGVQSNTGVAHQYMTGISNTGAPQLAQPSFSDLSSQIAQSQIPVNAFSFGSGFANRFRNGAFNVWQRGTASLATSSGGSYTADGWIVAQTGAQGTCGQDTGIGGALYSLKCIGTTSNTDTKFSQRIESSVAAPLAGIVITGQFQFKQTSGSTVTPKLSACYASAQDNFTTCTSDLAATSLTACANNTWCTETYTFAANALASQGYQITLDCNVALTSSQGCWIDQADIRPTPTLSAGINSSIPSPELRPISLEMPFDLRYLYVAGAGQGGSGVNIFPWGMWTSSSAFSFSMTLPAIMRTIPSLSSPGSSAFLVYYGAGSANGLASGPVIGSSNSSNSTVAVSATATGTPGSAGSSAALISNNNGSAITFSAEL